MIIHTIGDSHASDKISHWGKINIPNVKIISHHLPGKLMYSIGRDGLDLKNFDIKDNEYIIFCFGEIDCRNHVHKHIDQENDYTKIIDNIVVGYFETLNISLRALSKNNIKSCVYNVIPPTKGYILDKNHPYPFIGTDSERKSYHLYMNKKIKTLCNQYEYFYFDIYNDVCDFDGFLNIDYKDDSVHLICEKFPSAIIERLKLI